MTRKDYVALAEALRNAEPRGWGGDYAYSEWTQCIDAIAGVLAKDNSRFDRERFVRACQGDMK